jgi:hypothetical protein
MKTSKLYEYLEATGILEHGSPEEIDAARKQYNNQRKAQWRRNRRAEFKAITVEFSPQEYNMIKRTAKKYRNPTRFVYKAAIAYGNQKTLTLDESTIHSVREVLLQNYHCIRDMGDDERLTSAVEEQLIKRLAAIEKVVMEKLQTPILLEEAVREAIADDPEYKHILYNILKTM